MVKCYACNRRFENSEEFYRHVYAEHGGIENAIYETRVLAGKPETLIRLLERLPSFVVAEMTGGDPAVVVIKKLRGVVDARFKIDVWDCRGRLYCGKEKEDEKEWVEIGYFSVPKRIYRKEIEEELEKLCWQVLDDRGGAINMSGVYYLDGEHIRKLKELVGDSHDLEE